MASLIPGFEYDIFISYRQKDNKYDGWVTEFVANLRRELEATFKEDITIYFDANPHDGLLETHHVDKSLEGKLKCLIFIPIISQTYCDSKSFAWQHEFCAFNKLASEDQFGRDIKLSNGNVASRILPVKIHDLDKEDQEIIEKEIGGALRSIEFIFKSSGVNRPLRSHEDHPQDNVNKTFYRDQVNKVANAVKGITTALKSNKSTGDRPVEVLPTPDTNRIKKAGLLFAGIIILLALSLYWLYPKFVSTNDDPLDKSIAVLPFVNISNDQSQDYFSEGLAIEITDKLTKISGLRVAPSNSIMEEYKETDKKAGQIAEELGVSYILEGSVRKDENNLRINVRLIAAKQNKLIWSETLDKPFTEVLQVQRDIAAQVASYLQITLTESDKGSLAYIPTPFISAYDLYLRSIELSSQRNLENEKAIELLHEAVKIDPKFVEAWAVLAFNTSKRALDHNGGRNWLDSAVKYAEKALLISPNSNYANRSMGFVLMYRNEFEQANTYLKKSIRLSPNSVSALRPISSIQVAIGRMDSAYFYADKLVRQDPRSGGGFSQKVKIFKRMAQWDSCQRNVVYALKLDQPKSTRDLAVLECIDFYIKARMFDRALKLINEHYVHEQDTGRIVERMNFLKNIYALQGDWESFSKIEDESDVDWAALLYKRTHNESEFDRAVIKMKLKDPYGKNLLLLTNNFAPLLEQIKTKSRDANFSEYQLWIANPFAQEFIQTTEFKTYFADYENWLREMMLNIQKMNQ